MTDETSATISGLREQIKGKSTYLEPTEIAH